MGPGRPPVGAPVGIIVPRLIPCPAAPGAKGRSGWVRSHPESSTHTTIPGAPVEIFQPVVPGPPAWMRVMLHCWGNSGSFGVTAIGTIIGMFSNVASLMSSSPSRRISSRS